MKKISITDIDHDLFTAKRVEDIIVLNLTEDLLLHAVDLREKTGCLITLRLFRKATK